jgi:hypothetical protein
MAGKLIALCAVVVSGCVPVIGTLYVPVNASDAVVNRYNVCDRSAFFNRKIGDGLTLEVSITESGSEPPQVVNRGSGQRRNEGSVPRQQCEGLVRKRYCILRTTQQRFPAASATLSTTRYHQSNRTYCCLASPRHRKWNVHRNRANCVQARAECGDDDVLDVPIAMSNLSLNRTITVGARAPSAHGRLAWFVRRR